MLDSPGVGLLAGLLECYEVFSHPLAFASGWSHAGAALLLVWLGVFIAYCLLALDLHILMAFTRALAQQLGALLLLCVRWAGTVACMGCTRARAAGGADTLTVLTCTPYSSGCSQAGSISACCSQLEQRRFGSVAGSFSNVSMTHGTQISLSRGVILLFCWQPFGSAFHQPAVREAAGCCVFLVAPVTPG